MRATLETAPVKRPWNKSRGDFLVYNARERRPKKEKLDIRWVSAEVRVSVSSAFLGGLPVLSQIVSITIGANWVLNRDRFFSFAPGIDLVRDRPFLDDT